MHRRVSVKVTLSQLLCLYTIFFCAEDICLEFYLQTSIFATSELDEIPGGGVLSKMLADLEIEFWRENQNYQDRFFSVFSEALHFQFFFYITILNELW